MASHLFTSESVSEGHPDKVCDRISDTVVDMYLGADAGTLAGIGAAGLPHTYPLAEDGAPVPHTRCQPIGMEARAARLRGVHARSAQSRDGAGRELAWFPASARSIARRVGGMVFTAWFKP